MGVLLLATLQVVRSETERQVDEARRVALARAEAAFADAEEFRRQQLARVAAPLTRGIRAAALMEEAVLTGDYDFMVQQVAYELERNQMEPADLLLSFADPNGEPLQTVLAGSAAPEPDPAGLAPLFARTLAGDGELLEHAVADGRLYTVQIRVLTLGPRVVGLVALGFPIDDGDATAIAEVVGVELCFVADGRCVAGSPGARDSLQERLVATPPGSTGQELVRLAGERWHLQSEALDPQSGAGPLRAIAIPMDEVLGPFERISRTLGVAGLAALLLAAFASVRLAGGLTRPVQRLVQATERVARGAYDAEVPVDREDELGTLASSFNEMTKGLRLKERYRGVLDKVVSPEVAEELMQGDLVLGGEIREVTVLFADLRGFTALTEGLGPGEVIALVNECMFILSAAVDAEGGVVDKYVGDELMALWGAPVTGTDDPGRAVAAALRMQEGIAAFSRKREDRGEPPVGLGIGVNTGPMVAGNVGSPDRLNYTVLGAEVNLGARLCGAAGPGEILLSAATAERVGERARIEALGERSLKGFSRTIPLYRAHPPESEAGPAGGGGRASGPDGSGEEGGANGPRSRRTGRSTALAVALLATALVPASPVVAQEGAAPTLRDLGASWISDSGTFQLDLGGRLDLEGFLPSDVPPGLLEADGAFFAPRLSLFADIFAGESLYALVEVRADRGEQPTDGDLEARVEQAYVRWSPDRRFQLQAGRFPSPFGGWPIRHRTDADPFVRPPLPYDHRTLVTAGLAPQGIDAFFERLEAPEATRDMGAPPIWAAPYPWGAMATSTIGPLDLRAAWVTGAPGSEPESWSLESERLENGSLVVGAGLGLGASLRLDVSYSAGPYMEPDAGGPFPAGTGPFDFDQTILGVEAVWTRGAWVVRGEGFLDKWAVPNVGGAIEERSGYVEVQRDLFAGFSLAGRVGGVDILDWPFPDGETELPWDHDVVRYEVAAGYRFYSNLGVRAQVAVQEWTADPAPDDDLLALQLWWAF